MQLNDWMERNRYSSREVSELSGIKYARLCSILREEMEIGLAEIIAIDYVKKGEVNINDCPKTLVQRPLLA